MSKALLLPAQHARFRVQPRRKPWRAREPATHFEISVIEASRRILAQSRSVRSSSSVFTITNGRALLRDVDVGHSDGIDNEVLTGLTEGDSVILHPTDRVNHGVSVEARRQ